MNNKKIINWNDKNLITEVLLWLISPERGEDGVSAGSLKKFIAGVIGRIPPTSYMTSFQKAAVKFYPDLEIIAEGKARGIKYMVSCKSLEMSKKVEEPAVQQEQVQKNIAISSQADGPIKKEYYPLSEIPRLSKIIIKGSKENSCTLFHLQRVLETTTIFPVRITEQGIKSILKENSEFSMALQNGETRVTLVKGFYVDEPEEIETLWQIPDPVMQKSISDIPGVTLSPLYPGSKRLFLIKHKNLVRIQDQIVDLLLSDRNSLRFDDEEGILLLSSAPCYRYSLIMGYNIAKARKGSWRKGYITLNRSDKSDLVIRQGEDELYNK